MIESNSHEELQFIVVEGPIGAGKTTLARRLAGSFNAELILEKPEENPFLERFYENPEKTALPAQLAFLLQRARQLTDIRQTSLFHAVRIADFMMEKDRLFAELNLQNDEFDLYEQLYQKFYQERLVPDLVVYLQASVPVLRKRIAHRGIQCEQWIGDDYLRNLNDAYARFFYHYDASPLLIVNSETLDFANKERDYELLLSKIHNTRRGRSYFNPISEVL